MKIEIKQIEGLQLPTTGTPLSAGYDVVAIADPEIVGEQVEASAWKRIDYVQYRTAIFIAPVRDDYRRFYHTLIFPRSSVSKYNLLLANCVGLIDNDYRGEVILRFKYIWQPEDLVLGDKVFFGNPNIEKMYKKGDKIGQLVAEVTNPIEWIPVAELSTTERTGGFGSTDDNKIFANPIKFDERPSNMAERYRKGNYYSPPDKTYEQVIKEAQKG